MNTYIGILKSLTHKSVKLLVPLLRRRLLVAATYMELCSPDVEVEFVRRLPSMKGPISFYEYSNSIGCKLISSDCRFGTFIPF